MMKRENLALAKENKRDVQRKKALDKKLFNSYIAVKHLEEDVREEAIFGAPADWESLGNTEMGDWDPSQCSFTLHNIIAVVKRVAK